LKFSSLAGWNQTAEDWSRLLELAPRGCFGTQIEETLTATATLFCYGNSLAWIGMVLTHPDFRRQGLATSLIRHVLGRADELGIPTVKLDATEIGEPLYRSLGFFPEQRVERWSRAPNSPASRSNDAGPHDLAFWAEADASAFGADRSRLLHALLDCGQGYAASGGYLLTRAGKNASYLGPCVAEDAGTARRLMETAFEAHPRQAWCWDLLPANGNAFALATELGFRPQRRLLRMFRGEPLRSKEEWVYAIAGFEFG